MPIVPQVYWRCGPHDANCSTGLLQFRSAWCQLFCRFIEDVIRMMPIVPQVYWSCDPHDANCSAGFLKLWSALCQLFRRFIEDMIHMMPIVAQVYWSCDLHDANCSAGFLKLWSAWRRLIEAVVIRSHILSLNLSFLSLSPPPAKPNRPAPPPPPGGPADWILPWGGWEIVEEVLVYQVSVKLSFSVFLGEKIFIFEKK